MKTLMSVSGLTLLLTFSYSMATAAPVSPPSGGASDKMIASDLQKSTEVMGADKNVTSSGNTTNGVGVTANTNVNANASLINASGTITTVSNIAGHDASSVENYATHDATAVANDIGNLFKAQRSGELPESSPE